MARLCFTMTPTSSTSLLSPASPRPGSRRAGTFPDPSALASLDATGPLLPIVPVRYARDGRPFEFFSTVTTLGTPQDVTLQELRIECFYPADDATREQARALARRHSLMAGGRSRRTM